ncbi:hypothetical protein WDW89_11150 [Deltaproteobacteria bacterium TL4]
MFPLWIYLKQCPQQPELLHLLNANGWEIQKFNNISELRQQLSHKAEDQVLFLTDSFEDELISLIQREQPYLIPVIYSGSPLKQSISQMIQRVVWHHIAYLPWKNRFNLLLVTLQKLARGASSGMEPYFSKPFEIIQHTFSSSEERYVLIDELSQWMTPFSKNSGFQESARLVAEELLMNAFYSAPVNASGQKTYDQQDRSIPVQLSESQGVEFGYGFDGTHLGISVKDVFGSFDKNIVPDKLNHYFQGTMQISSQGGGAGLGLTQIFRNTSCLVFNIAPNTYTEAIAFLDMKARFSEFLKNPAVLSIFF